MCVPCWYLRVPRKSCQNLVQLLEQLEIPVTALHSGLPSGSAWRRLIVQIGPDQHSRFNGCRFERFRHPEVDLVVNFDLPKLAEDYVHRVGRTARAGRSGWSLSFASQYDIELLKAIELGDQAAYGRVQV